MRVTGSTKPSSAWRDQPIIIGVSGGSGSGKTYFAEALRQRLSPARCSLVFQDNFYIDQSNRFDFDGGSVNFDHPDSIDFDLLIERLQGLKAGKSVEIPIYDFVTHRRKAEVLVVQPTPVILVDGILIFHSPELRQLFNHLVYFDTAESLRFSRRLERDVKERGRTPDGVRQQFYRQVKPMHDQFVEPAKIFASTVVHDTGDYVEALDQYVNLLSR